MKSVDSGIECDNIEVLVPDYEKPCENCGQIPTVATKIKDNIQIMHYHMCGPCLWGDAETIDPENW